MLNIRLLLWTICIEKSTGFLVNLLVRFHFVFKSALYEEMPGNAGLNEYIYKFTSFIVNITTAIFFKEQKFQNCAQEVTIQ